MEHFSNKNRPTNSVQTWLTIPETARQLGIPCSTLRRAVKLGQIPHHRPFSQRIRLRLSEVEAAILAQERAQ